jgi:hypothetical protein
MAGMQNWTERYVCGVSAKQGVVGNRDDGFGGKVTQLMFDNHSRLAEVCPFVRDSLDYDVFWIEESNFDDSQVDEIEHLARRQLVDFKTAEPAFDPETQGPAQLPVLWKTFLTFFPRVIHKSRVTAGFPLFDDLHAKLKPDFIKAGLMLGQFYAGCPQPAIYNEEWTGPLASPYPAFAIRYIAKHDKLFISPTSSEYEIYKKFFPEGSVA